MPSIAMSASNPTYELRRFSKAAQRLTVIDPVRTRLKETRNVLGRRMVCHTIIARLAKGPCDEVVTDKSTRRR